MERNVVATTVGGPPEFVTPEAGVLVDPSDHEALAAALERAAALPTPNPAARKAAGRARRRAARWRGWRRSSSGPRPASSGAPEQGRTASIRVKATCVRADDPGRRRQPRAAA